MTHASPREGFQLPPWAGRGKWGDVRITDVRTILTAPEGTRLVIVKVDTNVPGLYGVGCATFSQRALAVAVAVESYLKPFVVGRSPGDIEDVWQASRLSSYWRSGPVLNNALSGVDQALWDICGKLAGVPVHQFFGGRVRTAAEAYVHVKGRDVHEIVDRAEEALSQGFRHIRIQPASPGRLDLDQPNWDSRDYARLVPRLLAGVRERLGDDVELLHDAHERLSPSAALQLAKDLEPHRLFFLEDLFAPEDHDYLRAVRQQTSTPIASGELYVNRHEYVPVITERLVDFIRPHVSAIGGLSPARKLAALAEFFGVRTAWHGPDDVSPVGHAAQLQLDLSASNFGIREVHRFGDRARAVFPGTPEIRNGAVISNDAPGLGIDVDEREAGKHPYDDHVLGGGWPTVRAADGSVLRP